MRPPLLASLSVLSICAAAAVPMHPAAASAGAAATATVSVSGKLPGHAGTVVLAVGRNGRTLGVRLTAAGAFSLKLPKASARDTSLQLVSASGRYAGPVVLAAGPRRAYTALGGTSADLGTLTLRAGYATVGRKLVGAAVDSAKWSLADNSGKPAGAGRLGMVRMATAKHVIATAVSGGPGPSAAAQPGDDSDGDAVPNLFDADDNGNGTLDIVDPASAQSNAGLYSILSAPFAQAINANTGPVSTPQIDELLSGAHHFVLGFFYDDHYTSGRPATSVNVDCYTLAYCRKDTGTAEIIGAPDIPAGTTWASYSPDGSGLPNLTATGPGRWQMGIEPNVTSASINPGDAMSVNFTLATGEVISVPTALAAYFVTTPAITHWQTTAGSGDITYTGPEASTGEFTTPDGKITLTAFRPQRPGFSGEPAYLDMGHLHWGVTIGVPGQPEHGCGGYFTSLSPTLHNDYNPASTQGANELFPLHDQASDAAPGSGNTVQFTLDVAGCARHFGLDPAGLTANLKIAAATESRPGGMDRAAQEFTVQLP